MVVPSIGSQQGGSLPRIRRHGHPGDVARVVRRHGLSDRIGCERNGGPGARGQGMTRGFRATGELAPDRLASGSRKSGACQGGSRCSTKWRSRTSCAIGCPVILTRGR